MTAILQHEVPMRWADLDELSHVNNVVYLDYAAEARAVHVGAGDLPEAPVRSVSVEYLRPMLLSTTPVRVRSWLDDVGRVVQEVAPVGHDACFARVTTEHGTPEPTTLATPPFDPYLVQVRRSDLGADGTVTATKLFEYVQEARVAGLGTFRDDAAPHERIVVARVDVTPGEPMTWRPEPYTVSSGVTRIGTSSFRVRTVFDGGRHGHADAVVVGFDQRTQRSRPLTATERVVLEELAC